MRCTLLYDRWMCTGVPGALLRCIFLNGDEHKGGGKKGRKGKERQRGGRKRRRRGIFSGSAPGVCTGGAFEVFFAEVASAVCVGARLWILFLQYQG